MLPCFNSCVERAFAATATRRSGFFYEAPSGGPEQRPWFLSFTFAVACCAIVSGCLAERARLLVYPAYTVLVAAVVHPIIVHWVWVNSSWLNNLSSCRVLDFAGGLAVHALGKRTCPAVSCRRYVRSTLLEYAAMPAPHASAAIAETVAVDFIV